MNGPVDAAAAEPDGNYILEDQIGFILRQVNQRHTAIFAASMGQELTPTQWAAIAKLLETGACTQNLLGRLTAMDAATIKGVVDRLIRRGLAETRPDPANKRRLLVDLTAKGVALAREMTSRAVNITRETLKPLSQDERKVLLPLLMKLR
jgi:MarR family transcriptional regulator, lower aerobic nicotinate degradation pathway regulator